MKETYNFNYTNENDYKKLERSLKKYHMITYKKLYFEYYPSLKEGNFLGTLVNFDSNNNIESYELELPTDRTFSKIHGTLVVKYKVDKKNKEIILDKIEPYDVLIEGHNKELTTYKGVMISKNHSDKDMFKINLLNMIGNDSYYETRTTKRTTTPKTTTPKKTVTTKKTTSPKKDKIKELEDEIKKLEEEIKALSENIDLKKEDSINIEEYENIDDVEDKVDSNYSKQDLEKNNDFEINEELRNYAIKKIFDECKELQPSLAKYYINKGKIELTNSYMGFVLNYISDEFEESYNIPIKIQKFINDFNSSNFYKQVQINFDDFYKEYEDAVIAEDKEFYYEINNVTVNGYYLKSIFDILGHSIIIEISSKDKPVLFTNSDGEEALLMPITK